MYIKVISTLILIHTFLLAFHPSNALANTYKIDCNYVNIKHEDNLIILTFKGNFSITKKSEFIITGNQATIKIDKSSVKKEIELPENFSELKKHILNTEKTISLNQIKSLEVDGDITFTSQKDRIKLSAASIKSLNNVQNFLISNPKIIKTSSPYQDIYIKALSTILDTNKKTIKLKNQCYVKFIDKDTSLEMKSPSIDYNFYNSKIDSIKCNGTIKKGDNLIKFSVPKITYYINTNKALMQGGTKFEFNQKAITGFLMAKNVEYSPDIIKAFSVLDLKLKNKNEDNLFLKSENITYCLKSNLINIGSNSYLLWTSSNQERFELITDNTKIDIENAIVKFEKRSELLINNSYRIKSNSGIYNQTLSSGSFLGNVELEEVPTKSQVKCEKLKFSIKNGIKRVEIENLRDANLKIEDK